MEKKLIEQEFTFCFFGSNKEKTKKCLKNGMFYILYIFFFFFILYP